MAEARLNGHPAEVQVPGYPKLAAFQAKYPELAIFRRFSGLNMLNLLYFQAELHRLEIELDGVRQADFISITATRRSYHSNWQNLSAALPEDNAEQSIENHQYHTFKKIRKILKEYNDALIQNAQLIKISAPLKDHRIKLRDTINMPMYCGGVWDNIEIGTWSNLETGDFVTMYPQPIDAFTRTVLYGLVKAYHAVIGKNKQPDLETGMWEYRESTLATVADVMAIIVSGLIPVCAILSLYYTPVIIGRVFVSFGFVLLLAGLLWSFSSVKRNEIFAFSAALLAIEVVFIGSTDLKR